MLPSNINKNDNHFIYLSDFVSHITFRHAFIIISQVGIQAWFSAILMYYISLLLTNFYS